jgi:hypothetical protein
MMRWWKVVGLAGLAGVAATGAVVVRAERKRRAYTPDEVRNRLHQRVAEAAEPEAGSGELSSDDIGSDDISVAE